MSFGFTTRQKKKYHKAANMSEVIHRTEEQETGLSLAKNTDKKCSSTTKTQSLKVSASLRFPQLRSPVKVLSVILTTYRIAIQLKET